MTFFSIKIILLFSVLCISVLHIYDEDYEKYFVVVVTCLGSFKDLERVARRNRFYLSNKEITELAIDPLKPFEIFIFRNLVIQNM